MKKKIIRNKEKLQLLLELSKIDFKTCNNTKKVVVYKRYE